MTINEIKSKIESLVKKETGVEIEWTMTGDGFTVSGNPEAVKAAKPWFSASTLKDEHFDEELNETFAYYK